MGLTINYKLSVEKNLTVAVVRDLAERVRLYALKIGCAEVSAVLRAAHNADLAPLFVFVGKPEDACFGQVAPRHGWLVDVWPGDGCESATFGLCQYQRWTLSRTGMVSTGYEDGWLLKSSCKTQYASEHGWDHFLLCHKRIISVLDFWRQLGVTVEVSDEGGYWETRSEEKLRYALKCYDNLVAMLAGACKDAADDAGSGLSVKSPVFARKDFERLEAEGWRELARPLG